MLSKRAMAIISAKVAYRNGMGFNDACNHGADTHGLPEYSVEYWKRFKRQVKRELREFNDLRAEDK